MMYLKHLDLIESTVKKEENRTYYKTISAIGILRQTPEIFNAFNNQKCKDKGAHLLAIYGLLQNMFVAIDALYDLCKMLMHYKFAINVNQNETLREIKYIRNDVIGHPTHRTYPEGGIGFSIINTTLTTKDEIYYDTHFFKKHTHKQSRKQVLTKDIMTSFLKEANPILKEVYKHMENPAKDLGLSDLTYRFFKLLKNETFNMQMLSEIEKTFKQSKDITNSSQNRILWRIRLLKVVYNWKERDSEIKEIISYLSLSTAYKLYEMTCIIESVTPKKVKLESPYLMDQFKTFITENKDAKLLTKNLHDHTNSYHAYELEELKELAKPYSKVIKLLNFLSRQTDGDKVYLVGSLIQHHI